MYGPPPSQIKNEKLIAEGEEEGSLKLKKGKEELRDYLSFRYRTYQLLKQWYGVDYEI